MGSLFGGSSKTQKSTTTQQPWAPAQGALKNILSQADKLYDKNGGLNAEWIDKEIADLTPEMQNTIKEMVAGQEFKDMISKVQSSTGAGMSGIGSASDALAGIAGGKGITTDQINQAAKDLYQSELVQSQKGQLAEDVNKSLAGQIKNLNQTATASGNMGSSRAGVAEGVATGEAAKAIAQGSAAIENSARESALNQAIGTLQGNQQNQLSATNALGSLGINSANVYANTSNIYNSQLQNALQGSSLLQQYNQSKLDNQWFNATGAQNAGWANLQNYFNIVNGIGSAGGTTTSVTPVNNQGMIQGMLQGGMAGFAGGMGQGFGSSFSDSRLKDNLKLVQEGYEYEDEEGDKYYIPALYTWDWNDIAKEIFTKADYSEIPAAFGVIAQELEEHHLDEFVIKCECDVDGFGGMVRLVNYPALYDYVKETGALGGDDGDVQA